VTQCKAPGTLICLALLACACSAQPTPESSLWAKLSQGGYVLLLAHADAAQAQPQSTPFSAQHCSKQDQLSERGRLEAQRLKQALRSHAVSVGRVLTSSDCRCIATAGIVFGRAEPWSIIDDAPNDDAQMRREKRIALREAISRWKSHDNLALVTHQSNIQSALEVHAQPAEVLVIEPLGDAGYRLLGALPLEQ